MAQPPLTADQVRKWADYAGPSPFYQRLTQIIASDSELLRVLNRIENPPRPNTLFAAVQYLMARDGGGDLAVFYPGKSEIPAPTSGLDVAFRDFVLGHEADLVELGRSRYTQTNECRRCVALLPAIWASPLDRFHLIDLGTSAGLNLHLDRYHYRWDEVTWGPASDVELETEMRGRSVDPRPIQILSRTGLDLKPIDATDADDRRWLEALVWPEQTDRLHRLQAALDLASQHPVELVAGDATETLGLAIDRLPDGEPVIVINSFVLNQFRPQNRDFVNVTLEERRVARPIYRVSMEWLDNEAPGATLEIVGPDGPVALGLGAAHGEWLELYALP